MRGLKMEKVALLSMGCVCLCSKARAIRIIQDKEEWRSDTVYSYNITDMDDEQRAELVKDLRETPKQKEARHQAFLIKQRGGV
jgi:hypothetical protein